MPTENKTPDDRGVSGSFAGRGVLGGATRSSLCFSTFLFWIPLLQSTSEGVDAPASMVATTPRFTAGLKN